MSCDNTLSAFIPASLCRWPARRSRAIALLLAASAGAVSAQSSSVQLRAQIDVSISAERIVEVEGPDGTKRNQLVAATTPAAGEELIYTVSFANTGGALADGVRVTSPIPPEASYVDGTAYGPGCDVLFSVDGGRSFGAPNELRVADESGSRAAAASDYTHIRWVLSTPLAPGAKGFARFRAVGR